MPWRTTISVSILITWVCTAAASDAPKKSSAPTALPVQTTPTPAAASQPRRIPIAQQQLDPQADAPFKNASRLSLQALCHQAVLHSPKLAGIRFSAAAAAGKAHQAALLPNPILSITGDELGDRNGARGIWTAPQISQELVPGEKRRLAGAVVAQDIPIRDCEWSAERFRLLVEVRQAYFALAFVDKRLEQLIEAAAREKDHVAQIEKLVAAKQSSAFDLLQAKAASGKSSLEIETAKAERSAALSLLAVVVGWSGEPMSLQTTAGDEAEVPPPDTDWNQIVARIETSHPELLAAKAAVAKARLDCQRVEAEAKPNVTVSTGYIYQGQNRSSDWLLGFSVPLRVWNRQQGNRSAASAQLSEAEAGVCRVRQELGVRLSAGFAEYAQAKQRANLYQTTVLPQRREAVELARKRFKAGELERPQLMEVERLLSDEEIELINASALAWKSAAALSGLALEVDWPPKRISAASSPLPIDSPAAAKPDPKDRPAEKAAEEAKDPKPVKPSVKQTSGGDSTRWFRATPDDQKSDEAKRRQGE